MSRRLHLIPMAACEEIGADVEIEIEEGIGAEEAVNAPATLCDASAEDESGAQLFST